MSLKVLEFYTNLPAWTLLYLSWISFKMVETTDCSSFADTDKGCGMDNGVGDTFNVQRSPNKVVDRISRISCFLKTPCWWCIVCWSLQAVWSQKWLAWSGSNLFESLMVFLEVKIHRQQKHENLPNMQRVHDFLCHLEEPVHKILLLISCRYLPSFSNPWHIRYM